MSKFNTGDQVWRHGSTHTSYTVEGYYENMVWLRNNDTDSLSTWNESSLELVNKPEPEPEPETEPSPFKVGDRLVARNQYGVPSNLRDIQHTVISTHEDAMWLRRDDGFLFTTDNRHAEWRLERKPPIKGSYQSVAYYGNPNLMAVRRNVEHFGHLAGYVHVYTDSDGNDHADFVRKEDF